MHADSLPHNSGIQADKQYTFTTSFLICIYCGFYRLKERYSLRPTPSFSTSSYVGLVVVKY